MTWGQIAGRLSLRDIVDSMHAQSLRLYHIGSDKLSRTTLARINENKLCQLYEALFQKLFVRCFSQPRQHQFKFHNPLYALDSRTIDLCLSVYPWAKFRSTKGAAKLHVGKTNSLMGRMGAPPHISMAVFDTVDEEK